MKLRFFVFALFLSLSAGAETYPVKGGKGCPDEPCPAGEQCFRKEIQCKRAPCPSPMWCEPIQAESTALPKKGAGSSKGKCAENSCPEGQECVLIEVHCVSAPCPPIRQCVDAK